MYCFLVEVISASILQSDWIIGNVRQYGYYRVTYSDENWNKLINQLNEDHTVRKRRQTLTSVRQMDTSLTKKLDVEICLRLNLQ